MTGVGGDACVHNPCSHPARHWRPLESPLLPVSLTLARRSIPSHLNYTLSQQSRLAWCFHPLLTLISWPGIAFVPPTPWLWTQCPKGRGCGLEGCGVCAPLAWAAGRQRESYVREAVQAYRPPPPSSVSCFCLGVRMPDLLWGHPAGGSPLPSPGKVTTPPPTPSFPNPPHPLPHLFCPDTLAD